MWKKIFPVSFLVCVIFATNAFAVYILTDLGTLGGTGIGPNSHAQGINNSGQIVGNSYFATTPDDPYDHDPLYVFLWDEQNGMQPICRSGHFLSSINDYGLIVGSSSGAFVWEDGNMVNIGTFGSTANDINNLGQIVGGTTTHHAALWNNSTSSPIDLGTFGGQSSAWAINEEGIVVGGAQFSDGHWRAYYYDPNDQIMHEIPYLGEPGDDASAVDINDNGQIVGYSDRQAFLYNYIDGTIDYICPDYQQSQAEAINNIGQVVGHRIESNSIRSCFIWEDGYVRDLNMLISDEYGIRIMQANDINDNGQIVGYGSNGHAILLTPDYDAIVTSLRSYDFNIVLSEIFSFEYWFYSGIETQSHNLDILYFYGGVWNSFWGYQLNFDGSFSSWQTASFVVPIYLRGLETQIRFGVIDFGTYTNPTVFLRNIASTTGNAPVPEPTTILLLGTGLLGLAGMRKRF